jgi:flagellar basal-body rod modification protein FlgD
MTAISSETLSSLGLTPAGTKDVAQKKQSEDTAQKDKLGQADFLLMMTQQLKNQDPVNPMDNGAFLAQLAQISTVQGLGELNKKADQFLGSTSTDQALRGAALIGRQVEVPGNALTLGADGDASASINVTGKGPVSVVVQDANGVPVRTLSLPAGASGSQQLRWDGRDDAGNRLPAGSYAFAASQVGGDGKPVTLDGTSNVTVESVSLGKDGVTLNLPGGQTVQLSQVQRIS